jgi:hypothetical protein
LRLSPLPGCEAYTLRYRVIMRKQSLAHRMRTSRRMPAPRILCRAIPLSKALTQISSRYKMSIPKQRAATDQSSPSLHLPSACLYSRPFHFPATIHSPPFQKSAGTTVDAISSPRGYFLLPALGNLWIDECLDKDASDDGACLEAHLLATCSVIVVGGGNS